MEFTVRELTQRFTDLWWESEASRPPLGPGYTVREQLAREAHLDQFLRVLVTETRSPPCSASERQGTQERILSAVGVFARRALGLQERHISLLLGDAFPRAAIGFAQAARRYDPAVSGSEIFQASRNAWTMNGLQLLLGIPLKLTPAILAYSMLYPYSDNYLDDPRVPESTKIGFSERFGRRLMGEEIAPDNAHERTIYALVQMIEEQYERSRTPRVFESLLAIHRAQEKSLRLLRGRASPYEVDVLGISFEKGGASVLADGYLVASALTPAQEEFAFGWGVFLQLVDDLQDVRQDATDGLLTVYSQAAGRWPLDALTHRTFHFGNRVLERLSCFDAPDSEPLKELMRWSATRLLIDAAGGSGRLYSRRTLWALEAHSPFRFSFIAKRRRQLARQHAALMRLVEAFAA